MTAVRHRGTGLAAGPASVFLYTGLGSLLVSLDVSVANSLLPAIGATYGHPSRAALSWVITAYAISFAAALVPAGRLADRIGRRRVFLGGAAAFGAASVLCGLAPDLPLLVSGRVVQGVSAAALSPASLGLLLHAVTAARRAIATARWGGMGAVGIGSGPLVGGVATDLLSWRWAFLLNAPVVALILARGRVLPETPRQLGRRLPDPVGVALLAGGTALVTLGISEVNGWGWRDGRVIAALVIGVGALAGFWRRSLRVAEPVLDLDLLRNRHVAAVTVVSVGYSAAFFGLLFSFVAFLAGPWHLSLTQVGAALLPMAGTVAPLTLVVGQLAGRFGFKPPILLGALLMATGLALHASFDDGGHFDASWLACVLVVGLGVGLVYPLLGAATVAGLDGAQLAAASAVNQCGRQLGAALGIAAMVAVLGPGATVGAFHDCWWVAAGISLTAAAAALAITNRPTPRTPNPAPATVDGAMGAGRAAA